MINIQQLRREYLADLRDERAANRAPRATRFFESIEEAFAEKEITPDEFSIRELMENFIMDETGQPCGREIVQSWNPRHGEGTGENLTRLMESGAVTTGAFANISGQIVYNEILGKYEQDDYMFTKEIPVVNTPFSGERIAGIGGIGDKAETVPEGQAYPIAGVNEDYIDTPATTKRGLIVPLTKEAAFFDRTGLLLSRCSEVGLFLGLNKEKRAIDCVIDENRTEHRYNRLSRGAVATYGDNSGNHDWDNLQASNALSNWVNVDAMEQLLYSILDPNTGEPIQISGDMKLICARGLLKTAEYIARMTQFAQLPAGFATSGNTIQTWSPSVVAKFTPMTSRLLGTRMALATSWYYGSIKQACRYMQNWPLTTVQAPSNSELEFTQDIIMRWKSSERGVYSVTDPRYLAKATA